jgi:hypothetical protein
MVHSSSLTTNRRLRRFHLEQKETLNFPHSQKCHSIMLKNLLFSLLFYSRNLTRFHQSQNYLKETFQKCCDTFDCEESLAFLSVLDCLAVDLGLGTLRGDNFCSDKRSVGLDWDGDTLAGEVGLGGGDTLAGGVGLGSAVNITSSRWIPLFIDF